MTDSYGPTHGPSRIARAFLTLALVAVCGFAAAAPSGPDEVPADLLVSDWKLGPFYAKPSFEIVDLGYNSNPFNEAAGSGEATGMFLPGLRLALPFGENVFSVTQKFGYSYFSDTDERRNWSSDTDIKLSFLVGALQIDLSENFLRTNNLYGVELLSRQLRLDNVFSAQVSSDHEAGGYFEAAFTHRGIRFDEDEILDDGDSVSQLYDRAQIDGRFDLFLDMLVPGRVILGGRIGTNDFRFGSSDRDADGYFVYSGIRFDPERAWTGDIRAGYRRVEVGNAEPADLSGFGLELNLSVELGGRGRLDLHGSRTSDYSEYSASNYAAASRYGAGVFLPLGDAIAIEIGADFANVDYPTSLDLEVFDGGYDFIGLDMNVHLPLGDEATLIIGFGHRDLTSDQPGLSYDGIAFNTGFRYGT